MTPSSAGSSCSAWERLDEVETPVGFVGNTPAIGRDVGGIDQLVPVALGVGIALVAQDLEKGQPHALEVGGGQQAPNEEIAVLFGAGGASGRRRRRDLSSRETGSYADGRLQQ